MNRRAFLKFPLAAGALAATARALANSDPAAARASRGFKVAGHEDRQHEELLIMGGKFDCKVSARDTGGELCIYDTYRQAKGGPALHRHHFQDEWFYVIRGDFVVQVGDDRVTLGPGDSAFAPRKIPHAFAKTSDGEGQMLVLFQPAGSMEDFFLKMSAFGRAIPQNQEVVMKQLWADHGMEVVGPPLSF